MGLRIGIGYRLLTHTLTHSLTLKLTPKHTHTHQHSHAHSHTPTLPHTLTHTHSHTYTQTHGFEDWEWVPAARSGCCAPRRRARASPAPPETAVPDSGYQIRIPGIRSGFFVSDPVFEYQVRTQGSLARALPETALLICGLAFAVSGFGMRGTESGFWVYGLGVRGQGFGFLSTEFGVSG